MKGRHSLAGNAANRNDVPSWCQVCRPSGGVQMQDSRSQRKTRHENAVCGLVASADTFCVSHRAIGWLLDQCNGSIRVAESLGCREDAQRRQAISSSLALSDSRCMYEVRVADCVSLSPACCSATTGCGGCFGSLLRSSVSHEIGGRGSVVLLTPRKTCVGSLCARNLPAVAACYLCCGLVWTGASWTSWNRSLLSLLRRAPQFCGFCCCCAVAVSARKSKVAR